MEVNGSAFHEWARSARVEKTGIGTRVLGFSGAAANEQHKSRSEFESFKKEDVYYH